MFFYLLLSIILVLFVKWKLIVRLLALPKREADFRYRHFEYWFDEMIGYSELTNTKFKLKTNKQDFYGRGILYGAKVLNFMNIRL